MKNNALLFRVRKITSIILFSTLLCGTVLTGCSSNSSSASESSSAMILTPASASSDEDSSGTSSGTSGSSSAESSQTSAIPEKPTKDMSGNDLEVPNTVETVVSMAPSTTQLLIDLGLGDKIIAADSYSTADYADSLPEDVMTFDMMTPDNEQIVALKPDIVFTTGMSSAGGEDPFVSVREAGIPVADIPSAASIDEIKESILFIGNCVGEYEQASNIVTEMEAFIDEVEAVGETISDDEKVVVLYEMSTPTADYPTIYSAGPGSYIDEIITMIGAVNAAADADTPWPALTEEAAIAMNPDFILTTDTYTPDVVETLLNLEGWENVTAVTKEQVYEIDANALNRPNQHVCSAIAEIAQLLYPGAYKGIDDPFAD